MSGRTLGWLFDRPWAGVVLHQPELASSRIVELGQVPWPEVVEAVLAVPLD